MTRTNFNNESIFKHYFQSCQSRTFCHLPKFCGILNEKYLTPDINHEINPEITPKPTFLGCLVLAYCLIRIEWFTIPQSLKPAADLAYIIRRIYNKKGRILYLKLCLPYLASYLSHRVTSLYRN